MADSSSLALLRTSSIMALRRTMASRVDVCSSFTACGAARRLWHCCGPAPDPTLTYQHRLVQLLAALHVRCLDVNAVCTALPVARRAGGHGWDTWPWGSVWGHGDTYPCMSLKQLMQSMDFFSVENMM